MQCGSDLPAEMTIARGQSLSSRPHVAGAMSVLQTSVWLIDLISKLIISEMTVSLHVLFDTFAINSRISIKLTLCSVCILWKDNEFRFNIDTVYIINILKAS